MPISMQSMPQQRIELATDLAARLDWEQAVADEYGALSAAARRMSQKTDPAAADARARMDAAQQRMAASVFTFTLRAIPRTRYRQLVATHPPREGDAGDAEQSVNVATFGDALIRECILKVVDHEGRHVDFDPSTDWTPLADAMTDSQWSEFYAAAVRLNMETAAVPPKRASS